MLSTQKFRKIVYDYYHDHKRNFVWRDVEDPYYIVVSELMLQQTQTFRVEEKFEQFIKVLPTFDMLAKVPFVVVLSLWKGLGYNRRALYLQHIAQRVIREHAGILPGNSHVLQTFDGIGPATASSIVTFAFNKPEVFIETNIRAVVLHHFFPKESQVPDNRSYVIAENSV